MDIKPWHLQLATLLQQLSPNGKKEWTKGHGHKKMQRRWKLDEGCGLLAVGWPGHTLSGRVTRGRGNSLTMPTNTIQWRILATDHILAPGFVGFHKSGHKTGNTTACMLSWQYSEYPLKRTFKIEIKKSYNNCIVCKLRIIILFLNNFSLLIFLTIRYVFCVSAVSTVHKSHTIRSSGRKSRASQFDVERGAESRSKKKRSQHQQQMTRAPWEMVTPNGTAILKGKREREGCG